MSKKIFYNHTLKEYNKKYRFRKHKLLKVSKQELDSFNLKYPNKKDGLLQNKKWWFIENTYYEIPKPPSLTWILNLNKFVIGGVGTIVVAGIVVGVLAGLNVFSGKTEKYTISFDCGDGIIGQDHIKTLDNQTIVEVAPNPKREGYTFDGWWHKKDKVGDDYVYSDKVSFPLTLDKNKTIYCKWNKEIKKTCTVTLKYDEDKYLNPLTVNKGSEITTLETPKKEDYKFNYWKLNGEEIKLPMIVDDDITLEADWTQNAFTVTFETYDGTKPEGTSGSGPYTLSHLQKLDYEPTTTKTGYSFMGWTEKDSDDVITYPYIVDQDKTLYAKWGEGKTYTVSFDSKGGSEVEPLKCTHISVAPTSTKEDNKLLGWSTTGSKEDIIEFNVSGGYRVNKDQTLYAVWEVSKFKVNLNHNNEIETREHVTQIDKKPTFPLLDHELVSWHFKKDYTDKPIKFPLTFTEEMLGEGDVINLYAKYERNAFKVNIIDETTTLSSYSSISTLNKDLKPNISKPNKTVSYYVKNNTNQEKVINFNNENIKQDLIDYVENNDTLNIYCKWSTISYSLKLIYPEFAPIQSKVLTNQNEVVLTTLEKFNIDNYEFKGWSYTKDGKVISDLTITLNEDKELYAIYKQSLFTLTINYKCGDTTLASSKSIGNLNSTTEYDINIIPKEEVITKDSVKYGYSKMSISGGEIKDNKFTVSADATCTVEYVKFANVSLYIKKDNVVESNPYETLENQYKIILSALPQPSLVDYKVDSYEDAGGNKLKDTITVDKLKDNKIIVVLTQTLYTIKLETNGGTIAVDRIEHIKSGSTLSSTLVNTPTRGDMNFDGWYKDTSLETKFKFAEDTNPDTITQNTTLYAKWSGTIENNTTVTFKISDTDYEAGARFIVDGKTIEEKEVTVIKFKVGSNDFGEIKYSFHSLDSWEENGVTVTKFPIDDGGTHTLIAKFSKLADACSVQMNAGDGKFSNEEKTKLFTVTIGTTFKDFSEKHESDLTTTLENYKFSYWKIYDITTESYVQVSDDYVFNSNVYLYAHYVDKIEEKGEKEFETSNWATFSYYADKGLEAIKEFYSISTNSSLVGETRTVSYNGTDFEVIVIGEGHDYADSVNKTGQTALTFNFSTILISDIYGVVTTSNDANVWSSSIIRKRLNVTNEISELFDEQLTKNVKTVQKKTMNGGPNTNYGEYSYTDDKFFLLSGYELNISTDTLKDYVFTNSSSKTPENVGKEGEPYTYFSSDDLRIRKYNDTATKYWTRSPYNTGESVWSGVQGNLVNSITTGGTINNTGVDLYYKSWYVDQGLGIVPAFAIGVYSI